MVRFAQISFKLHKSVVCSLFVLSIFYKTFQDMELNILISVLCTREYVSQDSEAFCETLIYNKCLLTRKNNNSVHCTHTKSSPDLVKNFEKLDLSYPCLIRPTCLKILDKYNKRFVILNISFPVPKSIAEVK